MWPRSPVPSQRLYKRRSSEKLDPTGEAIIAEDVEVQMEPVGYERQLPKKPKQRARFEEIITVGGNDGNFKIQN